METDLRAFAFVLRFVFVHSCDLIYVPPFHYDFACNCNRSRQSVSSFWFRMQSPTLISNFLYSIGTMGEFKFIFCNTLLINI